MTLDSSILPITYLTNVLERKKNKKSDINLEEESEDNESIEFSDAQANDDEDRKEDDKPTKQKDGIEDRKFL